MPASQVLQQLYALEPSSPDFLRVLYALIKSDEDEQYSSTLEGAELTQLVNFLDKALCSIHTTDDVFRQCLRKLRAICGTHATLPSSHIISGALTRIGVSAIAYGGFADVWHGEYAGRKVCIKALRVSQNDTKGLRKLFFKEAVVWKRLRHPNIVPFLGVTTDPLQFASEWMPNGTLTDYITANPDANRIALLLDVAEGLNFLHASYTIHGDLKGPNILVNHDGHACLADFGLTSIAHGNNSIATPVHGYTARWTAPEILVGAKKITREADVFSFGMVVMETFTGKHPLCEVTVPLVMMKIMNGERPTYPTGTEILGFVAPVWNMTVDCWRHKPALRPIMAAVVEFLRECYTLHATDPSLSTLPPWKPSGDAVDTSIYGVISPAPTDGNTSPTHSPTQSTGTSQNSGHSFTPTQEQSPTFNKLFRGISRGSHNSLDEQPAEGEPHVHPTQGSSADRPSITRRPSSHRRKTRSTTSVNSNRGSNYNPRNTSPKRDSQKGEKQPPKTAKARWQVFAALVRFKVFSNNASAGDPGAR